MSKETKAELRARLVDRILFEPPPPPPPHSNFIAGRPKAALLFGSLVILDVVCRYLSFFLSYINIKISKNRMLIVRLAGDHLYWKQLFNWLSPVMSFMESFCAVLFPTRCLG